MFGDARARVVASEAHDRPSVIAAPQDDVDLVTPIGAVLVVPERAGLGMDDEAERIAMPQGVDFGPMVLAAHEWVVARNAAIVLEAQDLPAQAGRIL
jgi:hypothetical protein